MHSPDLLYDEKLQAIATARDLSIQAPQEVVFLYQDEHIANLCPIVGRSYRGQGEPAEKIMGKADISCVWQEL